MIKGEKTAVVPDSEEHLPSRQTFLLRFSDVTRPEEGIYHGRVEHLDTGRTTRFTSFPEVVEFTKEFMKANADEADETS